MSKKQILRILAGLDSGKNSTWLQEARAERIKYIAEQCLKKRKYSKDEIKGIVIQTYPLLSNLTINSYVQVVFNLLIKEAK